MPSAPSIVTQNDTLNTLTWQPIVEYPNWQDYEYSVNTGTTWQPVTGTTLVLNDANYNIKQIQIRVKAGTNNQAGNPASNTQAYTTTPANISTRYLDKDGKVVERLELASCIQFKLKGTLLLTLLTNQAIDEVSRYHDNFGSYGKVCAIDKKYFIPPSKEEVKAFFATPLSHALNNKEDAGYWINKPEETGTKPNCSYSCTLTYHFALVKQSDGSFMEDKVETYDSKKHYRRYLIRHQANWLTTFKATALDKRIATAPTNLNIDDSKDTLSFTKSNGYSDDFAYEYSLDGGITWLAVASNPIFLINQTIAKEKIQLRVAETSSHFASQAVSPNSGLTKSTNSQKPTKYKLESGTLVEKGENDADYDCIKDEYLGVYWSKPSTDKQLWSDINTQLQAANSSTTCGFDDWSLPTKEQFFSLKAPYTPPYNKPTKNPLGRGIWHNKPFELKSSYYPINLSLTGEKVHYISASSYFFDVQKTDKANNYKSYYYTFARTIAMPKTFLAIIASDLAAINKARTKMQHWRNQTQLSLQAFNIKLQNLNDYQGAANLGKELENALTALAIRTNQWTIFNARIQKMSSKLANMDALVNANKENLFDSSNTQIWKNKYTQYKSLRDGLKQRLEPTAQTGLLALEQQLKTLRQQLKQVGAYQSISTAINADLTQGANDKNQVETAKDELTTAKNELGSSHDANKARKLYNKAIALQQVLYSTQAKRQTLLEYQTNLDALYNTLKSNSYASASVLAKLKAIKDKLDMLLNGTTGYVTLANKQQILAASAIDSAFAQGLNIKRDDAKITSGVFTFYKQDIKGRYIPASSTYAQGYRCVEDGRFAEGKRVWLLMQSGQPNSADMLSYSSLSKPNGLQTQANSKKLCGKNNWKTPNMYQLISLNTKNFGASSSPFYSIDTNVFVNHQGSNKDSQGKPIYGGFSQKRYYYWSTDLNYSKTKQKVYAYGTKAPSSSVSPQQSKVDAEDYNSSNHYVFARLLSDTPDASNSTYIMLDKTGNITTDKDQWVCSQDSQSKLTWLRPVKLPQGNEMRQTNQAKKEIEHAYVCGTGSWRLPTLNELKTLRGTLERAPFFTEISLDGDYLTSDKKSSSSNSHKHYIFATDSISSGYDSNAYNLWVTDNTNIIAGTTPSWVDANGNFVGIDKNGDESISGVFYCIKDNANKKIWSTPLLTGDTEKTYSSSTGLSSYSTYCKQKGDTFKYPDISDLTTLVGNANSDLYKYVYAYKGYIGRGYWSNKIKKDDPSCTGYSCKTYHYAIDKDGNEIEAEYSGHYPTNSNQKFYMRLYADIP